MSPNDSNDASQAQQSAVLVCVLMHQRPKCAHTTISPSLPPIPSLPLDPSNNTYSYTHIYQSTNDTLCASLFPITLSPPRLVQAVIHNERARLAKALKQIAKLVFGRGGKGRIDKHKQGLVFPQLEQATQDGE